MARGPRRTRPRFSHVHEWGVRLIKRPFDCRQDTASTLAITPSVNESTFDVKVWHVEMLELVAQQSASGATSRAWDLGIGPSSCRLSAGRRRAAALQEECRRWSSQEARRRRYTVCFSESGQGWWAPIPRAKGGLYLAVSERLCCGDPCAYLECPSAELVRTG